MTAPVRRATRRRRRAEQPVVPDPQFTSYYGRPVIKEPVWSAPDVAGYLFFGGRPGPPRCWRPGAQLSGYRELARVAKAGALGAISLSAMALVHDLGRPARFTHMLRVFKPSSPMSVGSWPLAAGRVRAGRGRRRGVRADRDPARRPGPPPRWARACSARSSRPTPPR